MTTDGTDGRGWSIVENIDIVLNGDEFSCKHMEKLDATRYRVPHALRAFSADGDSITVCLDCITALAKKQK